MFKMRCGRKRNCKFWRQSDSVTRRNYDKTKII